MREAQPWRPPAADRHPLPYRLWNALISHAGAPLALGGSATLSYAMVEPPPRSAAGGRLSLGSGQEVVAVPVEFPFAAYEADLATRDLPDLPHVLRDALIEGVLTTTAAGLPLAVPPEIRAVGLLGEIGGADDWPWFRITLVGTAAGPIVFDASASPADVAAVFVETGLRRVWPGLTRQLSRTVDASLGSLRLPVSDLRSWQDGTTVVMEGDAGRRPLRLRADDTLYAFEAGEGAWLCRAVERRSSRRERDGMADDDGTRADGTGLDVGAIPIDVDFDLGRASVPLAEIEGWQPGSLVALPVALTESGVPVTLRVNGSVIGSGDIVSIDGRVAVRISSLSLRG